MYTQFLKVGLLCACGATIVACSSTELLRLDGESGATSDYLSPAFSIPGDPAGDRSFRVDLPPDSAPGVIRPNYFSVLESSDEGHISGERSFRLEMGAHFNAPGTARTISDNEALFNFQSARTSLSDDQIFEIYWDARTEDLSEFESSTGAIAAVKVVLESDLAGPTALASFGVGTHSPECGFYEITDIAGSVRTLSFPRDAIIRHTLTWTTANSAVSFSLNGAGLREGVCERSSGNITLRLPRAENVPLSGRFRVEMKPFRAVTHRTEPSYDPANPSAYRGIQTASYNFDNLVVERK